MREKLPQALEALDKIKHEYRRFYDESMDETRSFDSGMRALLGEIDELICLRLDLGRGPAEAPDAAEGEADDDAANLSETIPKLYSSRMYKDYLKSQRHTRMPHYLTRVEESPKQTSSRRGITKSSMRTMRPSLLVASQVWRR